MSEKTCGECRDFWEQKGECLCPLVYIDHRSNIYHVTPKTKACFFFSDKSNPFKEQEKENGMSS